MATNYEKYFGTPEKLSRMIVSSAYSGLPVTVYEDTEEVVQFGKYGKHNDIDELRCQFLEWLQEECDEH